MTPNASTGRLPTVLVVFGTRPEAVKMAPVVAALRRRAARMRTLVCVTGQHREMLDAVLSLFDLQVDWDLALMEPDQALAQLTSRTLAAMGALLTKIQPDLVLVQGDTCSAMATAMAAFFGRVPVGHVEAGLRTTSVDLPFPEELNRRVIGEMATLHFAPTETARTALLREGVSPARVHLTGNTVVDALLEIAARQEGRGGDPDVGDRRLILLTAHRRENFGQPFERICQAVRTIVDRHEDIVVVYPVHLNPHVREPAHRLLGGHPRVRLVEPLDYGDLVRHLSRAVLVLTDSGGIQEEAPVFGKPVLVLRSETERPEGVAAGVARIVGADSAAIVAAADELLDDPDAYRRMSQRSSLYGDGRAAERIAEIVEEYLLDRRGRS
jgi:UDP-N-acetylglucosamine 2-epimerase (non-hydrolysing)